MKKIYALLITIMMFITACQPTPEEPVVQSKEGDLVQKVVDANNEENQDELQEDKEIIEEQIEAIGKHLNIEFQANDRVKIVVDAEVSVPVYDKIPLVRVRPENLTQEHLEKLINEVVGERKVYYQDESLGIWSKEEIEQIVTKLKGYSQNDNLEPHIKSHLQDNIGFLEEQYSLVKGKDEGKLYDGTLVTTENNKSYSHITSLKAFMGKAQAARIELWQSLNGRKTQLIFRNEEYGVPYNTFEPYEGVDAERLDMPYTQCKEMAEQIVKSLDGEDTNMKIYSSEIGYSVGFFADYTKDDSPQCYIFRFARDYNGVSAKPINSLHGVSDVNYAETVQTERLIVMIENDGVYSVSWGNYAQYMETLSQDVPLMDFDSVNDIFEDYCGYKFTWVPQYDNVPDDTTVTINIDRVELNLMMTLEKDSTESYIMIPVWDYIGDINYDQELTAQDGYPIEGEKNVSILTINAIDGTVIDREQGY